MAAQMTHQQQQYQHLHKTESTRIGTQKREKEDARNAKDTKEATKMINQTQELT